MKKYFKNNSDVFKLIRNKNIKIISIRPVKKKELNKVYISSYCVNYEKKLYNNKKVVLK